MDHGSTTSCPNSSERAPTSNPAAVHMRSKNGCLTCRGRKVKCNEAKPVCSTCTRLQLHCEYMLPSQAVSLHDSRVGAGPLKRRQYTGWRPQRIASRARLGASQMAAAALAGLPAGPPAGPPIGPLMGPPLAVPSPPVVSASSALTMGPFPAPAALQAGSAAGDTAMDSACFGFVAFVQEPVPAGAGASPWGCSALPTSAASAVSAATTAVMLGDLDTDFFFDDRGLLLPLPPSPQPLLPATFSFGMSSPDTSSLSDGDLQLLLQASLDLAAEGATDISDTASSSVSTPSLTGCLVLGPSTLVLASFPSRARLTEHDYEALLLFNQQVGFSVGSKSPTWSTHAILIKLSVHHAAILHFLLAASFGEQHWRQTEAGGGLSSSSPSASSNRQLARRHFEAHYSAGEAALRELAAGRAGTDADQHHVVVVACFWLENLIHRRQHAAAVLPAGLGPQPHRRYSAAFSRALGSYVRRHRLRRALVEEADDEGGGEGEDGADGSDGEGRAEARTGVSAPPPPKYRPFLARLIGWLFWADCAAAFLGTGGGLAQELYGGGQHYLTDRGRDRGRHRRQTQFGLYERGRSTLLDFWDDDYTPEQIADDHQNWPALQLVNETWVGVHRLNMVGANGDVDADAAAIAAVARDAREMRARYASVFRLSAFADRSGAAKGPCKTAEPAHEPHSTRLLATADWAVCHHRALELHLLHAGAAPRGLSDDLAVAPAAIAAQIVHQAERVVRRVGRLELDRFQWPLFWAGVASTDNAVYRYFAEAHLINAGLRAALQAVVRAQDAGATLGLTQLRAIVRAAAA